MQYALAKENHITVVVGCRKVNTINAGRLWHKSFQIHGTKDNKWMEKKEN